ncbi:hypothetical protein [Bradyrhizobium sp. WSM2793]|uniref:hypothetical protein n=1 Tax=Bradyrhizobium sp. WSM2793 TaxID=1038866 RepID=UPI0003A747E4|nr:hypothetical protein [Bradyrhizobium sp. WSM2793]
MLKIAHGIPTTADLEGTALIDSSRIDDAGAARRWPEELSAEGDAQDVHLGLMDD